VLPFVIEATVAAGSKGLAVMLPLPAAVAGEAVAPAPVTIVKLVLGVMAPMRVLAGMPVPLTNIPACRPAVFAHATTLLALVVVPVTVIGLAATMDMPGCNP
jgi:hypothetical protein